MNLEAFDNLQRVLRSVPEQELRMENWNDCAIGHASRDPWFQQRMLEHNFKSAARVFGVGSSEALFLFSVKAGRTPAEVLATLDRFVGGTPEAETELRAKRQAVIDHMLQAALKVERAARSTARALLGAFGF
jgi:hypothetical protein